MASRFHYLPLFKGRDSRFLPIPLTRAADVIYWTRGMRVRGFSLRECVLVEAHGLPWLSGSELDDARNMLACGFAYGPFGPARAAYVRPQALIRFFLLSGPSPERAGGTSLESLF